MADPRKTVRRHVTVPGILRETIHLRMAEFRYPTFAPFALELICFDIRRRRDHWVTRPFAFDTPAAQEALDRELVRHYEPGNAPRSLLKQAVFCETVVNNRAQPRGSFSKYSAFVLHSETIRPCIEGRWRELGFRNFSEYLTSVIRYDLLLLGPHKYHNGDETDPEIMESLDADLVRTFQEGKPQPIHLDVLVDQAAGRKLTEEERAKKAQEIPARIMEMAMNPYGVRRQP